MAIPVLVMGRSGSGKTYSLKNFKANEVSVISVEKGRLPFKSDIKTIRLKDMRSNDISSAQAAVARYSWLKKAIESSPTKSAVIDDSQYLLAGEFFDRAKETGYQKFTDMACNLRDLIHYINNMEDDNKIVYFLHHSEMDADGREKVKTIGKMLDEKLTVEGCFDIVLYCKDYEFYTQSDAMSSAKTPEGMFKELKIPNDLKAVDTAIRDYYGLTKNNSNNKEEKK